MSTVENDFGSYLVSVEERDIDLLLMEEFDVSGSFVEWFCRRLKIVGDIVFSGAWHSVSSADGETDLLLRIQAKHRRVGVLIENKVAAPEQPTQDERYHIRGTRLQQQNKFDEFLTCICAPQPYLDGLGSDSLYQHRISYEAIAEWFGQHADPRSAWRQAVIQQAIEQSRRGYKMIVNETITAFHMAYWEYLREHHPRLLMAKPTAKGSKSNWIILKGLDFPKGVKLHHKFDQRVLELGFEGRRVDDLLAIKADWSREGVVVVQKNGTAAISISIPEIDMAKSVQSQTYGLEQVFAIAYRLLPYANLLNARNLSNS